MAFVTELLGYIGLDVDDASFNDAQNEIADITRGMGALIATASAMASAVAASAFAMVTEYAQSTTELSRMSKRLNISTDDLQEWTYAASQFGIEQEAMADGMKELSMRTAEFIQDGKANADIFQALGLSAADVSKYKNNISGLFEVIQDRISKVQDAGKRQFLADALFGGGLADVGGEFFSQASAGLAALRQEARESGFILSKEQIGEAEDFNKEIMSIQNSFSSLWKAVAANLLPVMKSIADEFNRFLKSNAKTIIDAITAAVNALTQSLKYLAVAAAIMGAYMLGSAALAAWASLIKLIAMARNGMLLLAAAEALANALNPGFLLAVGIGLAIAAITLLIQDFMLFLKEGEKADTLAGRIAKAFKVMGDDIKKIWLDITNVISKSIDAVTSKVKDMMPKWLIDSLSDAQDNVNNSELGPISQRKLSFAYPGGNANVISVPTSAPVTAPPTSAPTAAQSYAAGMAQANGVTPPVVHNTTTVGEIVINDSHDPQRTAQAVREELRKTNASTVKGLDTGVKY